MNIGMIGLGYVGLVTAVGFAKLKHTLYCYDVDERKMDMLLKKEAPIYEIGLQEMLEDESVFGNVNIEPNMYELVKKSDVIFIAVGTPSQSDGSANIEYVKAAVSGIVNLLINDGRPTYKVIVIKSTVPVGLTDTMQSIANDMLKDSPNIKVDFGFCPEFLREGTAVKDFLNPERIVIGSSTQAAYDKIYEVFQPFFENGVPQINTNCVSAEIIKYASNIMLATKIALLNEIADYADSVGGRAVDISAAVGLDSRIGSKFLAASLGFGGSCFPKDVKAFSHFSKVKGFDFPIAQSVMSSNEKHMMRQVEKIRYIANENKCRRILVLGTAFKANTDDVRESPAIKVIKGLLSHGFEVVVTDPKALENTKKLLNDSVEYSESISSVIDGIDLIVICTEWAEYKNFDFESIKDRMNKNIIIDLRNILERGKIENAGFQYFGIAN